MSNCDYQHRWCVRDYERGNIVSMNSLLVQIMLKLIDLFCNKFCLNVFDCLNV